MSFSFSNTGSVSIVQGSQQNLEIWKTWRFEFYLSRSRNGMEFVPKSEKNLDKTQQN